MQVITAYHPSRGWSVQLPGDLPHTSPIPEDVYSGIGQEFVNAARAHPASLLSRQLVESLRLIWPADGTNAELARFGQTIFQRRHQLNLKFVRKITIRRPIENEQQLIDHNL